MGFREAVGSVGACSVIMESCAVVEWFLQNTIQPRFRESVHAYDKKKTSTGPVKHCATKMRACFLGGGEFCKRKKYNIFIYLNLLKHLVWISNLHFYCSLMHLIHLLGRCLFYVRILCNPVLIALTRIALKSLCCFTARRSDCSLCIRQQMLLAIITPHCFCISELNTAQVWVVLDVCVWLQ